MTKPTATPAVVLRVLKGPDAGRHFPLGVGHYRVIGRAFGAQGRTAMISKGERRRLDAEDHNLLASGLERRAAEALPGARNDVQSFTRDDDVDLADDAVSVTHAMVLADEAGAMIFDASSTNGCFVNGAKVAEAKLGAGDLIRVGETRFSVELPPTS